MRFTWRSRVDALFHKFVGTNKAIKRLMISYTSASIKLQKIEDLEIDLDTTLRGLPKDRLELSQSSKLIFFTQLESALQHDPDCAQDLVYLEQLLLDGHTITESVKLWCEYKLNTAVELFRSHSKEMGQQVVALEPRLKALLGDTSNLLLTKFFDQGYSMEEIEGTMFSGLFHPSIHQGTNSEEEMIDFQGWRDGVGLAIEYLHFLLRWEYRQLARLGNQEIHPIHDSSEDSISFGDSEEEQL